MDNLTKEQRRKNMQNIRSKETTPEKIIFKELRRRRIYFARHVKKLPGSPDIVFRRKRIAVFIDSDFWHGHSKRFTMPKTNADYWERKIMRNKARDIEVNRCLKKANWNVIRIWEYDVKKNTLKCINRILKERKNAH
tara:strand:+ start:120 stop:530 length:411 start_codon:yes stop_codon:yes gene_type:complete